MKKYLFISILLFTGISRAGEVRIEAFLDSSQCLIGDWITLQLTLFHPQDIQILPPKLGEKLGELDVISLQPLGSEEVSGEVREQWSLTASAYDTGRFALPPLEFTYHLTGDSVISTVASDSFAVYVLSAGGDSLKDIHDIKPPVEVKRQFADYLPYILLPLILGLILAGYLLWTKYRKSAVRREEIPFQAEIDPYDRAMKRLTELEERKLWEKGLVKEYYCEITDIVREYFEGEFGVPALEMTTEELLERLEKGDVVGIADTGRLLHRADLVKFAKFIPEAGECNSATVEAYTIIKEARSRRLAVKAREMLSQANGSLDTSPSREKETVARSK